MIDLDILGYEIKKRTEYVLLLGKIATQDPCILAFVMIKVVG